MRGTPVGLSTSLGSNSVGGIQSTVSQNAQSVVEPVRGSPVGHLTSLGSNNVGGIQSTVSQQAQSVVVLPTVEHSNVPELDV